MPRLGDPIELSLQLYDATPGLFPRVFLRDQSNALIGTVDLQELGGGLYVASGPPMPNTRVVRAQYLVYADAARTRESKFHSPALDVFELEVPLDLAPMSLQLDRIERELRDRNAGDTDDLTGVLEDDGAGQLTGLIEDTIEDTIDGTVEDAVED